MWPKRQIGRFATPGATLETSPVPESGIDCMLSEATTDTVRYSERQQHGGY